MQGEQSVWDKDLNDFGLLRNYEFITKFLTVTFKTLMKCKREAYHTFHKLVSVNCVCAYRNKK
jgi:hypothetical protein